MTRQKLHIGLVGYLDTLVIAERNGGKMSDFPFTESIVEENSKFIEVVRKFSKDLLSEELNWHRDAEHRQVKVLEGQGWYLQFENELPIEMTERSIFYIKKNKWHRIINKNGSNLTLNIRKFK
jgi:hypothetical protein